MRGTQIYQIRYVQVLVIDECGMDAGTGCMIDAKIVHLRVAAEKVALLLVDHQLLNHLVVFHHVQVQSSGRLAGPTNQGKKNHATGWAKNAETYQEGIS